MESPLNPMIWKVLFNAALGTVSAAALFSVYHQRRDMLSTANASFAKLRKASTEDEREAVLQDILSRLQSDAIRKQCASRLSAQENGAVLVRMIKLDHDGSNAGSVVTAVKVLLRVFGADAPGRRKLSRLGGFKTLLGTLSEAHRQGDPVVMEEAAEALNTLTRVNDTEVVLDTDVPPGAEGAYALAQMPATVKMLRILDPESPIIFLIALTGIFANVCTLQLGATNIAKGTDGHSGISFFLRLLEHTNQNVLENCVLAIRYMARANIGHDEIAKEENVTRLAECLQVNADPKVANSIMTIILIMAGASDAAEPFFLALAKTDAPTALFELWVRSPEKALRSRAEVLCRLLMRVGPTASIMASKFERYRGQIEERRNKDEQELQQQMQQAQQNQFMQRMMMEQMGMDPGMLG